MNTPDATSGIEVVPVAAGQDPFVVWQAAQRLRHRVIGARIDHWLAKAAVGRHKRARRRDGPQVTAPAEGGPEQ